MLYFTFAKCVSALFELITHTAVGNVHDNASYHRLTR